MDYVLPDGTPLSLPDGATGADAAAAIGPGLARAALAIKVNGELRDLSRELPAAANGGGPPKLEILTERSGEEALALIRHDTAHVLATAVLDLYPGVKISIGPAIENGFYYDFEFPEGVTVNDADFERIEAEMRRHIDADEPFVREDVSPEAALARFRGAAAVQGRADRGSGARRRPRASAGDRVAVHQRPVHRPVPRPAFAQTKRIKAFKLQSVAGSYWRGDSSRQMLTRVYGTAFFSAKELAAYLDQLERARANDHRRLGPQLGLFTFSDDGPGLGVLVPGRDPGVQLIGRAQP